MRWAIAGSPRVVLEIAFEPSIGTDRTDRFLGCGTQHRGNNRRTDKDALVQFVRARGLAVLATVSADWHPQAAVVGVAATDDGDIVFDTTRTSASSSTSPGSRESPWRSAAIGPTSRPCDSRAPRARSPATTGGSGLLPAIPHRARARSLARHRPRPGPPRLGPLQRLPPTDLRHPRDPANATGISSVVGAQNIQYWNVDPKAQTAKVFGDHVALLGHDSVSGAAAAFTACGHPKIGSGWSICTLDGARRDRDRHRLPTQRP